MIKVVKKVNDDKYFNTEGVHGSGDTLLPCLLISGSSGGTTWSCFRIQMQMTRGVSASGDYFAGAAEHSKRPPASRDQLGLDADPAQLDSARLGLAC
jgi:hypothetical protein